MKREDQNKADIGAGFLSGSTMSLGINIEETILSPFISGIKSFEIIVIIFSIITIVASIFFISQRRGIVYSIIIFILSFIGGYVIFMSKNPIYIGVGIIPVVIAAIITKETNRNI